jgi:hypothetical protein
MQEIINKRNGKKAHVVEWLPQGAYIVIDGIKTFIKNDDLLSAYGVAR